MRTSAYSECIKTLLHEIKVKRELQASLPVLNPETGILELPKAESDAFNMEDWDYRNFHDDWLPSWDSLKSKLTSVWKERKFSESSKMSKSSSNKLPLMFMPGAGMTPKPQCFGCGQIGHRKGDPGCTAGPECASLLKVYPTSGRTEET